MTKKILIIDSCLQCPYHSHKYINLYTYQYYCRQLDKPLNTDLSILIECPLEDYN